MVTRRCWIGIGDQPMAGQLTRLDAGMPSRAVLIVPPLAYEYWTSHRTLRTLAEDAAERGMAALRIDLPGTGDSAGGPWDDDQLENWRGGVRAGVDYLRSLGCTWVGLAGLRFGATLALTEAADVGADAVAAWLPVTDGKRYVRELTLLGSRLPEDDVRPGAAGVVVSGGVPLTAQTLGDLRGVTLKDLAIAPAKSVLLLGRPDGTGQEQLRDRLIELGSVVDSENLPGVEAMLDVSCERSTVQRLAASTIADWLARVAPSSDSRSVPDPDGSTTLAWAAGTITESSISLGSTGLVGMLAVPADRERPDDVVVFLNSGSEHSVGPGRTWVEYARALTVRGHATVRLDFRGWGESPMAPSGSFGNPYDPHVVDDIIEAVKALEDSGFHRVVLVGLCASSWVALKAVLRCSVAGMFALNPEFLWEPGDPWELTMAEAEELLAPEVARFQRLNRWHLWSVLDALGLRSGVGRWLSRINRTGIPVQLVYADDDLGIRHLRDRFGRQMKRLQRGPTVSLHEIPGIDHQMHREWLRPSVIEQLTEFVESAPVVSAAR